MIGLDEDELKSCWASLLIDIDWDLIDWLTELDAGNE